MRTYYGKAAGCLTGVMLGDAMGQPCETMGRDQILGAEVCSPAGTVLKAAGEPIAGFLPAFQTRIRETAKLAPGDWTDDWQLTEAVGEALVSDCGYDLWGMARAHIQALKASTTGWGKTTELGIRAIADYVESAGEQGRSAELPAWQVSPGNIPAGTGAGNGVAIKVAPLAIWCVLQSQRADQLRAWVASLASLTHAKPEACTAAYVLARTIKYVMNSSVSPGTDCENMLILLRADLQAARADWPFRSDGVTEEALEKLDGVWRYPDRLYREIGPGFRASSSVTYALGLFLRYPTDFRQAVLAAANDGGDSDSIASMVGALVGANCGIEAIPAEWISFRPEFSRPADLARRLIEAAE